MKLPPETIIDPRKITEYLLRPLEESDKSGFLARAGYTVVESERLLADLRSLLLSQDAEIVGPFEYGMKYAIRGTLRGPNGRDLRVVSYWAHAGGVWPNSIPYAIPRSFVKYPPFHRIALAEDLPQENLRRGDVATIVEIYEGRPGQEPGYELEVFNAVGETISVITVRESQIESLRSDEVLNVRPRERAAA